MLLIIIFHFNLHTDFNGNFDPYSPTILMHIFSLNWGETAVLAFIVITGYFTINQSVKISKIISIAIEVLFYSIVITIIGTITGVITFDGFYAIEMLFPIISTSYWFISFYVVLLILSPYLNKMLKSITKTQYILFISTLFFLTICLRIIPVTSFIFSSYIISFVLAYSIGGYFYLYPSKFSTDKKIGLVLILICIIYILLFDHFLIETYYRETVETEFGYWPMFFFMIASSAIILFILLSKHVSNKLRYLVIASILLYLISLPILAYTKQWSVINEFRRPDCGLCLILAISLFLIFKNMKPRYNKAVNWISASVLSVYIIHDSNVLRKYLWNDVVHANDILSAPLIEYLTVLIVSAIVIFFVCIAIDKVRIYLIFKPLGKWINRYQSFIERKINDISDSLNK